MNSRRYFVLQSGDKMFCGMQYCKEEITKRASIMSRCELRYSRLLIYHLRIHVCYDQRERVACKNNIRDSHTVGWHISHLQPTPPVRVYSIHWNYAPVLYIDDLVISCNYSKKLMSTELGKSSNYQVSRLWIKSSERYIYMYHVCALGGR